MKNGFKILGILVPQNIHHMVFALSRAWFLTQVLPISRAIADKIHSICGRFLWTCCVFRIARTTVTRPKVTGGLAIFDVRHKNNSLVLKHIARNIKNWYIKDIFIEKIKNRPFSKLYKHRASHIRCFYLKKLHI